MKRALLFSTFVVTASAHAATLSIQWHNQPGVDKISLLPSETAEIDVLLELGSRGGDSIAGLHFSLAAGPVEHLANSASLPGWSAGGEVNLPFGLSQFAAGSNRPGGPDDLRGTGSYVVGSFTIRYDDFVSPPRSEFEVVFEFYANNQIVGSNGSFWTFVPPRQDHYAAYSGYWTYGKGNPPITTMMDVLPHDPLIITKAIPEPASIVLLCLSGAALAIRRAAR